MTTTILAGRIRALPLLGCALAAAGTWWAAQHTTALVHIELLLGTWFFGLATAALLIIPRFTTLRLDAEGITQRAFARTHFFAWHDVMNVGIEPMRGHPFVTFTLVPDARSPRTDAARAMGINSDGGLDPSAYGLTARELLELIEQARRRA
ncbi:MAG: hypothetical protein ABR975_08695 [Vulcanimicrobiaceae bacterium]